jgi:hypothetical protein
MVWLVECEYLPPKCRGFQSIIRDRIICWNGASGDLFPVVFKEIKKRELFMKCFWTALFLTILFVGQDVFACSVCFGDPNSPMTHAAKAGVAVLLGIVGLVLCGIFAVAIYWIKRARLLQVQAALRGESIEL